MYPTNREIWRSVNGYANYEVSCFGRVRNATTDRILKPNIITTGYLQVGLYKDGKRKIHCIHKMVASEFLDNPLNLKYADHIDNNKSNNNLDNLRFCNHSQNGGNRKKQANTTSIYKGVCWSKRANKWRADIKIDGRQKNLGFFSEGFKTN